MCSTIFKFPTLFSHSNIIYKVCVDGLIDIHDENAQGRKFSLSFNSLAATNYEKGVGKLSNRCGKCLNLHCDNVVKELWLFFIPGNKNVTLFRTIFILCLINVSCIYIFSTLSMKRLCFLLFLILRIKMSMPDICTR